MFSPNELVHFVFADGNDSYYCNELFSVDLPQYLWLQLHAHGYGCVYFLELSDSVIRIKTYGDKFARGYTPEKGKIHLFAKQKVRNSGLRRWMQKTLAEKEPVCSAIVCDLNEFCRFFGDDEWSVFLQDISSAGRRSGILVLTAPPEAEASRDKFLCSPVFAWLNENSITKLRSASPCDLYAAMHRSKPDRMTFLNAFTKERIHGMLTRIILEDPKRTADCDLLPDMEDYLLQWMNNPKLRSCEPQIEKWMPKPDGLFRSAFEKLRREDTWNQLTAKAIQIAKAGGVRNYVESLECVIVDDPVNTVCVRRNADTYAGRCMSLRVHSMGYSEEEKAEVTRLLEEIRKQVSAPQNREENHLLTDAVNNLLPELQAADLAGDAGTVRRILFAISFCIQWLCVPKKSSEEAAILTVLEKLQSNIKCSMLYHDRQRSLNLMRTEQASGKNKLTGIAMRKFEEQTETTRKMLSTYEDVVQAAVVQISMASAASVTSLAESLSEELSQQNDAIISNLSVDWSTEPENEPSVGPKEPETSAQLAEDENYQLTDDDFSFLPLKR